MASALRAANAATSRQRTVACSPVASAARLKSPPMTDGPVLIVTGASSGIGAATARAAAEAGYRLVLTARRQDAGVFASKIVERPRSCKQSPLWREVLA